MDEPNPYFSDGLRQVKPYLYTFTVYAKGRWIKQALIEVLVSDFRAYNRAYYERAILCGAILVNGKSVDPGYQLKDRDLVSHQTHRHEPPVIDGPIPIVFQDESLVVISKPGSIPIHPGGNYRFNTVQLILEHDCGLKDLHIIHRIDAMTSGLLLLGRTKDIASKLSKEIRDHDVVKQYLARVIGKFPHSVIFVDQPILRDHPSRGMMAVHSDGKESQTLFVLLDYDPVSNTSLLQCRPYTGRTHQIRVHLQWLGFPILYDPLYSNQIHENKTEHEIEQEKSTVDDKEENIEHNPKESIDSIEEITPQTIEQFLNSFCPYCQPTEAPSEQQLYLCLHALSYQSKDWKYSTPVPDWTNPFKWNQIDLIEYPNDIKLVSQYHKPSSP